MFDTMARYIEAIHLPDGIARAYNGAMGIGQLIKVFRERAQWSQPQLARKSGVSTSAIWRLEHGERLGRGDTIARLVKVLGIDPAAAQAAMEEDGYQFPVEASPSRPSAEDLLRQLEARYAIEVPLVEQRAAAGYLGGATAYAESIDYLPREAERKHKLLAIRVSGTCLEPRLMDGHIAIIDRSIDAKEGDIVLALHEGEAILKELRTIDERPHLVALQGQPPIPATGETRIVGVVIDATYGRKV